MVTELARFRDSFATLTFAVYEPLVLRWYSQIGLTHIASTIAARKNSLEATGGSGHTALRLERSRLARAHLAHVAPTAAPVVGTVTAAPLATHMLAARTARAMVSVTSASVSAGLPPNPDAAYMATSLPAAMPVMFGRVGARVDPDARRALLDELRSVVEGALGHGVGVADALSSTVARNAGYHFFPGSLEEALSPIGVAHYYRQLFFSTEEGVGPIEQAFTVAPLEVLELSYETVRRLTREESLEIGTESVSEQASEEKLTEEVSEKVSSMVQRDMSAALSASASGGIGVWSASASTSLSTALHSERSREEASRRLKEMTRRASERMTRSFKVRSVNRDEFQSTNLTRRTIRNESPEPTSYGLRRVLNKQRVKVQDLGPRLVWQIYVRDPGVGLARSSMVQFLPAERLALPNDPPGMRPRPSGGNDRGSQAAVITPTDADGRPSGRPGHYNEAGSIVLRINPGRDRTLSSLMIDKITNLEDGDDEESVPLGADPTIGFDQVTGEYRVEIRVRQGGTLSVSVDYTYRWEPSQIALGEWERERQAAVQHVEREGLQGQFERNRELITLRSRVRARPAGDLRREERFEVMSRVIEQLFGRAPGEQIDPTPLEIETFHRFFEVEGTFVFAHPSWWRPHYDQRSTGSWRAGYEITAESQSAPMGASLGWELQLDGDQRRNEFLNSPWVRACVPIQPGHEREALSWLAIHAEGALGYDPTTGPIATLLTEVEARRSVEGRANLLGGAEWVTVSSTGAGVPTDPVRPENVYPVVSEFDIVAPTEGFVYERLNPSGR